MFRVFTLLTAVTLLQGCYTMYALPPQSNDNADVTFVVEGDAVLGYTAGLYYQEPGSKEGCYGGQQMAHINVGNPLDKKTSNPPNIPLKSGQQSTLVIMFLPANVFGQSPCHRKIIFTPQEAVSYRVRVQWDAGNCSVDLLPNTGYTFGKC